jgi:hypothetical protein
MLTSFMTVPPCVAREQTVPAANGKYKAAPKKVVSRFTKEQIAQMYLLNHQGNCRSRSAALNAWFLGELQQIPYEFLTDRSGLSDAYFAKFVTG